MLGTVRLDGLGSRSATRLSGGQQQRLTPARVLVSVRPEDVSIQAEPGPSPEAWEGTVEQVVFLGECVDCRVAVGDILLRVHVHPAVRVRRGDRVSLVFRADRCIAVRSEEDGPAQTGVQ